jgi:hypothetical protein
MIADIPDHILIHEGSSYAVLDMMAFTLRPGMSVTSHNGIDM